MNCGDCKYSHDTGMALLCWGQRFAPPVDKDHWCEGWKPKSVTPQTNADLIRQMTDEGIENWYWWMHKEMMHYTDSRVFVHDWLKAPVEEVDE